MLNLTVKHVSAPDVESGIIHCLMMNAYRAMCQQLTGPIPGYNFNITIAGIVAIAMRLGVNVDLES